jgi:hypothetical protein
MLKDIKVAQVLKKKGKDNLKIIKKEITKKCKFLLY